MRHKFSTIILISMLLAVSCVNPGDKASYAANDVILDSDANNELDDQHAIAYMLLNHDSFCVKGITTNATWVGGNAESHKAEADRVIKLMGDYGKNVKTIAGATGNFEDIRDSIANPKFDGSDAVDFIIETAKSYSPEHKLVLIPVGKLTNVALALMKEPSIIPNLRVVWLGSNFPKSGEYNLENDIPSMNYVLDTDVEFEIVTVGSQTGTSAVRVSFDRAKSEFAGKGPKVSSVEGRNGGTFTCFGDYSVDLFDHIERGTDDARALYDMAAVAIVKNPQWAQATEIPAPTMIDGEWVERPSNERKVILWTNFDKDSIIDDFISSLDK